MTDTAVLDTPKGKLELHVCKDGTAESDGWIQIYNQAFPPDQRQPVDDLKQQLRLGSMELDETRDQFGDILCMTITEVFRKEQHLHGFLLACYTAVTPDYRGLGVGTVHRQRMEKLLETEYPEYLGLFSEIESTKVSGLPDSIMETRIKRKRFFLKLGLKEIKIDYKFPSMHVGEPPLDGELLWFPFADNSAVDAQTLAGVLRRIYCEGYGLKESDPFIAEMTAQIQNGQHLV